MTPITFTRPLPFVWPYWVLFWTVCVWAFTPEYRIVRKARQATSQPGSPDAGSIRVILVGGSIASAIAYPLAWVSALRPRVAWQPAVFFLGIATLITESLLRRHCWRQLGASFTGDVRAEADQRIVTSGAYAIVRHPSYSAALLMNIGIGMALGSWGSTALLIVTSLGIYGYRIAVEERALLAAIGEPYREFMRTRARLIPFLY
jgi:protein-S-isoprenylcysteine O-methyltransferase